MALRTFPALAFVNQCNQRTIMAKPRNTNRQAAHRTTASFAVDRELLERLGEEVKLRRSRGEDADKSGLISQALIEYLGLDVLPTKIEIEGPPQYTAKKKKTKRTR